VAGWVRRYHGPGPLTEAEQGEIESAVRRCYRAAGMAPPETMIWVSSPFVGRSAARIAGRLLPITGVKRRTSDRGVSDPISATTRRIHTACVRPTQEAVWSRAREPDREIVREVRNPVHAVARTINHACDSVPQWNDYTRWACERVVRLVGATVPNGFIAHADPWSGGSAGLDTVAGEAWWLGPGRLRMSRHKRDAFEAWAIAARVAWWAHPRFAILSEPPEVVRLETLPTGQPRLHDADGPALRWRNLPGACFWHGLPVPLDLLTPGWPVERIHQARNTEIQRAAIERIGWLSYLDQAGLELIATAPDPGNPPHKLSLYADTSGRLRGARILVMINGSPDRSGSEMRYAEPVPATFDDPVAAAAWQYDVPVDVYRDVARRT